jgi:putative protease
MELLSPAGDFERLEFALDFGADAVYLGGEQFGMRASAAVFSVEDIKKAVNLAHARNVKVYLTANIIPHDSDLSNFQEFIENVAESQVDAVIVADLGVLTLVKKYAPKLDIHISTQTGVVNSANARMLHDLGAKRVVLARELSLDEVATIRENTPKTLEIETFVHGAMCVSFSGRCLLSQYLTGRDANKGECAQPCRWGYYLMEEKRPQQFYPIFEDKSGTFILNAKDLCMIEHLGALQKAGVDSFKIEGRAKSAYYTAVVTGAYRAAVNALRENLPCPDWVKTEVTKVSHRQYCTGFYFGEPDQYYENSGYIRTFDVAAIVTHWTDGFAHATLRNRLFPQTNVEILMPQCEPVEFVLGEIYDENMTVLDCANRPMMKFSFQCEKPLPRNTIVRFQVKNSA